MAKLIKKSLKETPEDKRTFSHGSVSFFVSRRRVICSWQSQSAAGNGVNTSSQKLKEAQSGARCRIHCMKSPALCM